MDGELTLDGNSAGGLLGEIFPFETTTVRTTCASCRAVAAVGELTAYSRAPGTVLRCVRCRSVLVRVVNEGRRFWLDLRGVACLELEDRER